MTSAKAKIKTLTTLNRLLTNPNKDNNKINPNIVNQQTQFNPSKVNILNK